MTPTQALRLAHTITQNDPDAIAPLVRLLYAFRESRGDPEGEIMMREVIGYLYVKTEHCDNSIKDFASIAA